MKVLIVCSYNSGRISAFITEQANALTLLGVEIDYFTIIGKRLKGYVGNLSSLQKKIDAFNPDLIHAHYGLSGALAVLQRKIPVVITFHNGETLSKKINFISSFSSLFAAYNIYVAQHIYEKCIFKRNSNFTILPCGVDVSNTKIIEKSDAITLMGLDSNFKHVLFGGAFDNLRKNYPLVKEALALLERKDVQVIEMKGMNREQITTLMCACDLFILPTKSEGSPQALKEAMICNCPIVATDVADIKYLMCAVDGCYITSFNPQDVANNIVKAIEFGKRTEGRARIVELGLDEMSVANKIIKVYKEVMNDKRNSKK